EPITETREDQSEEDSSEDTTKFAAEAMETSPDQQQQTLEASAEELAGMEESVDDPLEEVNVYLAYERFDQAEELVRNVISEHPEDHNYKLRLLEVFYSSNNKSAYEDEARVLHEAVGESDPLWESAVAMWAEMSPERALFEEPEAGAIEDVPADDSSAVVDITSQTQQPGGSTMTMAPGTDVVLESTQVGLGPAADQEDDDGRSLDFDIGGLEFETDDSNSSDETLDISGGLDFDGDATERNEEGLDLTIPDGSSVASPDEVDMVEMDAILPETSDLDHLAPSAEDDAELDLSLESPELDALADDVGEALDITGGDGGGDEASEIEFDLALEDTTEIDRLVIDDTLELPKPSTPDESLEDLAKSMEESMADLDLAEGIPNVEGEETGDLDLSLADTSGELDIDFDEMTGENAEAKLDFDLDDIDLDDVDPADTVAMERSDLESVETANDLETMALPPDEFAPRQSDAGEVDTKLNLAKAYIELGENDGARSIIDEVRRDGTDEQKAEAQRLIEQLD
ncbi:MAG: FimV/HubP family polar landmark protein, partial [Gammaproteobacteria bacterium]